MRIGTIHAFCQSLLRRFPLEAALSPHFQLVDDRDADDALTEAREDMLANARHRRCSAALRMLAGLASAEPVRPPRRSPAGRPPAPAGTRWTSAPTSTAAQRRALGITGSSEAEIIADARQLAGRARPARGRPRSSSQLGAKTCRRTRRTHPGMARPGQPTPRVENWADWCSRVPHHRGRLRAPPAPSSARRSTDRHPDLPQTVPGRGRAHHRRDRRLPRAWRWPPCPPPWLALAAPVLRGLRARTSRTAACSTTTT